jgi:hypothetical protein
MFTALCNAAFFVALSGSVYEISRRNTAIWHHKLCRVCYVVYCNEIEDWNILGIYG